MIFRQLIHDDLGCASYLVGDGDAGVAAVVDPHFEIDEYLELARYLGVCVEHILETHTHADHVSGHGRLAEATGATIHVHRAAGAEYPHEPFDDGWELALGRLRVRAIHTPGHRPEHTAFALVDTGRGGDAPWAVLTGDSLFVGDVARPDLAVEREEGARALYRSLTTGLLRLPPETEVWPGHLGGSMCGGPGMDQKIASTIGFELGHNPLLSEPTEEAFVARALAGLGPQPPRFGDIVALNRGPLVTGGARAAPLSARQVERLSREGGLPVDVRADLQFAEAHVPGAVLVTHLRSGFGTRLAWVAGDQEIVLIGRDDADGQRAAGLAGSVGVTRIAGYLAGGMTSWREEGRPVARMERVRAEDLPPRLAADPALQVLDVRERSEWDAGHLAGAVHVPYHDVHGIPDGIDPARPVAVICVSGQRSGVGASLLKRAGVGDVIHVVDGGVGTLAALGRPLVAA